MKGLLLLILGIAFSDALVLLPRNHPRLQTLRGRVVFPTGSNDPVETDGVLTVELRDVSLADAPAKIIGKSVGRAIQFPMAFAIKYHPGDIIEGLQYSLQATIRNKQNELLYINDVHVGVSPVGLHRTKNVDVPVILVKKPAEKIPKGKWFELVGKKGSEAVEIIKKETGFKDVMAVNERSPVTMDYRTDRVRVFVNDRGIVSRMPMIA